MKFLVIRRPWVTGIVPSSKLIQEHAAPVLPEGKNLKR